MTYPNNTDERIAEILRNSKQLTEIINHALREAVAQHLRADHSVATWRDNRVVWLASPHSTPASDLHGRFRDDPTFDDFLVEVAAARQEADEAQEP